MANATRRTEVVPTDDPDVEYTVSQYGLEELESLEAYIRGCVIRAGDEAFAHVADPDERDKRMRPVIKHAMSYRIDTDDGFAYLENIPGYVRMVHQALKRKHPDVTLERCREIVSSPLGAKLFRAIAMVNGGLIKEKEPGESTAPLASQNGTSRQTAAIS